MIRAQHEMRIEHEHVAGMLAGVDRAAFAVALISRLRAVGLGVPLDRAGVLSAALDACPPVDRGRLYWVTRTTLVLAQADVAAFDEVFGAVFADAAVPRDARPRPSRSTRRADEPDDGTLRPPRARALPETTATLPWATLPRAVGLRTDGEDAVRAIPRRLPGARAVDPDVPFEDLDEHALGALARELDEVAQHWPTQPSRRRPPRSPSGAVDLRATLARSRSSGWEPIELVRRRPTRHDRRLVVICDVSQSMQPYVTVYLHLMRALARHREAEVFAFGTSLTRLTAVLRHRSVEVAVERAGEVVVDRFAGTRLGSSLNALLASHHGNATRGAIVVIASDGWDSDPPHMTAQAMARLRRRARRILWLNPHVGAPGFEPLAGGMAAALPHCDSLLAAQDLRSLGAVVHEITDAQKWRRPGTEVEGVRVNRLTPRLPPPGDPGPPEPTCAPREFTLADARVSGQIRGD